MQDTTEVKESNDIPEPQAEQEQPIVGSEGEQEEANEKTEEQINWKRFREQQKKERAEKEEERRKREESERQTEQMRQIVEALSSQQSTPMTEQQKDDLVDILNLEDYTTGDQVAKYVKKVVNKDVESVVEKVLTRMEQKRDQERKEQEKQELPTKLKRDFSDWDKVCNNDNFDYLTYHYPEVAALYSKQEDSYEKWSGLYRTMKKLIPNIDRQEEQAKMERNANRPRSASTPGVSASTDRAPRVLTKERMEQNWERMKRQAKGLDV